MIRPLIRFGAISALVIVATMLPVSQGATVVKSIGSGEFVSVPAPVQEVAFIKALAVTRASIGTLQGVAMVDPLYQPFLGKPSRSTGSRHRSTMVVPRASRL
jgi:hypothetical protein